eukprot:NODE_911_length_3104_cov_0.287188.p1 type:complete len:509 gc:universal NODE_911_length_3104_cov_0.287188:1929-403(-)
MKRVLYWLRRDLGLHDNLILHQIKQAEQVIPLYIVHQSKHTTIGPNRWQFLQECLQNLDEQLEKSKSKLFIARGDAIDVLKCILKEWQITHLAFDGLSEMHGRDRDLKIINICKSMDIQVIETHGRLLYKPAEVIQFNGHLPKTYASFCSIVNKLPVPDHPLPIPNIPQLPQEMDKLLKNEKTKPFSGPKHDFSLFNIDEFTKETPTTSLHGGESLALEQLTKYCKDQKQVANFEKPKTSPARFIKDASTTILSPHLTWGSLSVRQFYWQVNDILENHSNHSKPPVSLIGQLLWRDFFHSQAYAIPNYNKMKDNPICLQIKWDDNQEYLDKWTNGQTGFPWIDAIMIQLRTEGWIHHLARHSVACFLTRGDLYQNWEGGLKVFQKWLVDHDFAMNGGNWMWLSASAYFSAYFRVYSPITFGQKYDKNGEFIKKYLPQLKDYNAKYIYNPWMAPKDLQKKWNCLIGDGSDCKYPNPVVDHKEASNENKVRMKEAYSEGIHGNSKRKLEE